MHVFSCLLLAVMMTHGFVAAQETSASLHYKTSEGWQITVGNGRIAVNGRVLLVRDPRKENEIIYESLRNKVIENGGVVFLFLEVDGSPNLDRLQAYKVTETSVTLQANAISSPIYDMDGDGFVEFGGADLTEYYPSPDSMYYIPSQYFEVSAGKIVFDQALTREMDLRTNYVYLERPAGQQGFCCKVIVKPGKRKLDSIPLVHPNILSERIDGPANIRDTVNGDVLFQLDNNVPVLTTDTVNKWCQLSLTVVLTEKEYKDQLLKKGRKLWSSGVEIGEVMTDIGLINYEVYENNPGYTVCLTGYTSVKNIQLKTLPENVLADLLEREGNSNISRFADLIKGYGLSKSTIGRFTTFQLDGGPVYGPSAALRLLLVFHKGHLLGIVHLRKLGGAQVREIKLHRVYKLAVVGAPDQTTLSEFERLINAVIDHAD